MNTVVKFVLNCAVVEDRKLTVHCDGVNGVINESEVTCIYDSGQIQEKCRYNNVFLYRALQAIIICMKNLPLTSSPPLLTSHSI